MIRYSLLLAVFLLISPSLGKNCNLTCAGDDWTDAKGRCESDKKAKGVVCIGRVYRIKFKRDEKEAQSEWVLDGTGYKLDYEKPPKREGFEYVEAPQAALDKTSRNAYIISILKKNKKIGPNNHVVICDGKVFTVDDANKKVCRAEFAYNYDGATYSSEVISPLTEKDKEEKKDKETVEIDGVSYTCTDRDPHGSYFTLLFKANLAQSVVDKEFIAKLLDKGCIKPAFTSVNYTRAENKQANPTGGDYFWEHVFVPLVTLVFVAVLTGGAFIGFVVYDARRIKKSAPVISEAHKRAQEERLKKWEAKTGGALPPVADDVITAKPPSAEQEETKKAPVEEEKKE